MTMKDTTMTEGKEKEVGSETHRTTSRDRNQKRYRVARSKMKRVHCAPRWSLQDRLTGTAVLWCRRVVRHSYAYLCNFAPRNSLGDVFLQKCSSFAAVGGSFASEGLLSFRESTAGCLQDPHAAGPDP